MTNVDRARLRVDRAAKRYARWANEKATPKSRVAFTAASDEVSFAGRAFAWELAMAYEREVRRARATKKKRR
jgi:hypothetical protein